MKTIVVQGSKGFIGRHLVAYLKETEPCADIVEISGPNDKWPHKIDQIYALGGHNGTNRFYKIPFTVSERNITAPMQAINYAIRDNASIVFASSSEVAVLATDKMNYAVPTDEVKTVGVEDITNNRWSYATAKIAAEALMLGAAFQFGLDAKVVRLFNIYGPNDPNHHVIPDIFNQLSRRHIVLKGGENERSFLYVEDCCSAFHAIMNRGSEGQIYNIGSDAMVSMVTLAKVVCVATGIPCHVESIPAPEGSCMYRCPDTTKLRSLGWEPSTRLYEGLEKCWKDQYWINEAEETAKRPYNVPAKRNRALRHLARLLIDKMHITMCGEILNTDGWITHMEKEREFQSYLESVYNANITLIDINPAFEKAEYHNICSLPKAWTNKFDAIIDWSTCDHSEDLTFVHEYARTLKPGGKLLIINGWDSPIYRHREVSWSDADLGRELDTEFKTIDHGYCDPFGKINEHYCLHPLLPGCNINPYSKHKILCTYHWRICECLS